MKLKQMGAAARTDIRASQDFSISLSFSTQLQHHQTITNIDAVYIKCYPKRQDHGSAVR
jgi:hypothetical protein